MQLRETFKNHGNTNKYTICAVSASLALHICIALILITITAISTRLKLEEGPIIHVSLVSINTVQKSYLNELPESGIQKKRYSKNREGIVEPMVVVKPIKKQDRVRLPVETNTHPIAEMQSINPAVVAIPQLTGSGTKDATTIQYDHKGQYGSVVPANSSVGELSLAVPRYRDNAHPVYPSVARMRGYEGIVLLSVEIFANGRVGSLMVKKSSGYNVLDESAREAVSTWKFEPGRKLGNPVTMWVDVPVKFVLKNNNTT